MSSYIERRLARVELEVELELAARTNPDSPSKLRELLVAWGVPIPDHADDATLFRLLLSWLAGSEPE